MKAPACLEGVGKRYGEIDAVRQVTLTLERGETVALVGHNGAGKTTLMKLILGIIRPSSGNVRLLGTDPAARRGAAIRRLVGFLPEVGEEEPETRRHQWYLPSCAAQRLGRACLPQPCAPVTWPFS